jgi:hypothetical protein
MCSTFFCHFQFSVNYTGPPIFCVCLPADELHVQVYNIVKKAHGNIHIRIVSFSIYLCILDLLTHIFSLPFICFPSLSVELYWSPCSASWSENSPQIVALRTADERIDSTTVLAPVTAQSHPVDLVHSCGLPQKTSPTNKSKRPKAHSFRKGYEPSSTHAYMLYCIVSKLLQWITVYDHIILVHVSTI